MAAITGNAIREALEPILAFTSLPSFAKLADDFIVTKGSPMAARQLTAGDLRRARTAYDAIGSGVKAPVDAVLQAIRSWGDGPCDDLEDLERRVLSCLSDNTAARDRTRLDLGNLLAIIHRDGGHYELEHGTAKAVEEAHRIIGELLDHTAAGAGPVGKAVAVPYDDFLAAYGFVPRSQMYPRSCLKSRLRDLLRPEDVAHADEAESYAARPVWEPGEAVAWRDMTSAPKDGTVIWLYQPHDVGGFMFAGAINADGVWINNLDLKVQDPTHWMPLPANPGSVRPVEEPGEVERLRAEGFALAANQCRYGYGDEHGHHRCAEIDRLTREIFFAKSALAEARGLIRDAIGLVPLAHQNWHTDARAALTGDAQEAGR